MRKTSLSLSQAARWLTSVLLVLSLWLNIAPAEASRPRAKIENGNLVTSTGERLRGAPFFLDVWSVPHMRNNELTYKNYFLSVARDYGMNCVRISPWIGNWEYDVKNSNHHRSELLYMMDKCVDWAEEANIYAVVNLHTKFGTVLTREKVKDFWEIVAPRYKDKTHVIFEAVNEPNVDSAVSTMQGIYTDLRALAPNTHIILWSLADPGVTASFGLSRLQSVTGINYANASFGFHIYDWQLNDRRRWEKAKEYRNAGYPVVCTEMMSFQNADNIPIYYPYLVENIKHAREAAYDMSWMQWAPRFNYAGIQQNSTYSLTNADIGFFQIYKDELLKVGINFWGSSTPSPTPAPTTAWSESFEGTTTGELRTASGVTGAMTTDSAYVSQGSKAYLFTGLGASGTKKLFEISPTSTFRTAAKVGSKLTMDVTSRSVQNWNKIQLSVYNSTQGTVQLGQLNFTPNSRQTLTYTFTNDAITALKTNNGKFEILFVFDDGDGSSAASLGIDNLKLTDPS